MYKRSLYIMPLALMLASCGKPRVIAVGSMDGTEQRLLGEIVAQHLEARLEGVEVQRRFGMGDTPILYQALLSRQIDLYPEYASAVVAEILKEDVPRDPVVTLERARQETARRDQVDLLNPLGFDARFTVVVPASSRVSTISQAAEGTFKWRPGVSLEFLARSDGMPNFNAYRLPLAGAVRAMQPDELFPTMMRGEIDMLVASQSDSHFTQQGWKTLADDRNLNPSQQAVLLVSQEKMREHPKLKAVLDGLSGKLTLETMRRLNAEVDLNERPARDVAAEFVRGMGP